MGVHGLTTYLRENNAALAKTLQFTSDDAARDGAVFVVDAWSYVFPPSIAQFPLLNQLHRFIYEVLSWANLPWVYGGEYEQFSDAVTRVVRAWLSVGLRLYFVFDGASFGPLRKSTIQTVGRSVPAGQISDLNHSHEPVDHPAIPSVLPHVDYIAFYASISP